MKLGCNALLAVLIVQMIVIGGCRHHPDPVAIRAAEALQRAEKASELLRGGAYADPWQAVAYLDQAIDLNPELIEAYRLRGLAFSQMNLPDRAVADYSWVIRLDPGNEKAYYLRGMNYFRMGEYRRALQDYDRVIAVNPQFSLAYVNRARCRMLLDEFQSALKDCNEALRQDPELTEAVFVRADVAMGLGIYHKAVDDYQRVLQMDARYTEVHGRLCAAHGHLRQYRRSIIHCDKAIRLDPQSGLHYHNRGVAYVSIGDLDKACKDFGKCCELGDCDILQSALDSGFCR